MNIVAKSCGKKPLPLRNYSDASLDEMTVKKILALRNQNSTILALRKSIYVSLKINLICQTKTREIKKTT